MFYSGGVTLFSFFVVLAFLAGVHLYASVQVCMYGHVSAGVHVCAAVHVHPGAYVCTYVGVCAGVQVSAGIHV